MARARAPRSRPTLLALAGTLACAGAPEATPAPVCGAEAYEPAAAARPLGTVDFDAQGISRPLSARDGFVAVALADAGRCVQLHEVLARGVTVVEPRDFGPYCTRCRQRESVLLGGGLFALPSDDGALGDFTFSLALRDCATFTSSSRPTSAEVRWIPQTDPAPSRQGAVRLDVIALQGSWLDAASGERLAAALARAASQELADASVVARVASLCAVPTASPEFALTVGDPAPLLAALDEARRRCPALRAAEDDPRVTVLSVGCLRVRDTVLSTRSEPDGYTTHVPGGAAPTGVAGLPSGAARVLAHELGHYFGLYHSVETDGSPDTLDDTTGADLMNAVPSMARARGLSPTQVRIVRRHPAVRWPRAGREACAGL